jgi:hypothetical protein
MISPTDSCGGEGDAKCYMNFFLKINATLPARNNNTQQKVPLNTKRSDIPERNKRVALERLKVEVASLYPEMEHHIVITDKLKLRLSEGDEKVVILLGAQALGPTYRELCKCGGIFLAVIELGSITIMIYAFSGILPQSCKLGIKIVTDVGGVVSVDTHSDWEVGNCQGGESAVLISSLRGVKMEL